MIESWIPGPRRLALAIALLCLLACAPPPSDTIALGLIVDGTLEEAAAAHFAASLAVEEVNRLGGIETVGRKRPVALFVADTKGSPEGAVRAARLLTGKHQVLALVGPSRSRDALAVAPLAEKLQVVMLSPKSTHPAVTEGRRWVFRLVVTDLDQGRLLAQFAHQDLGATNAALLYDAADAYGRTITQAFRDAFEARGGKLSAVRTYTTGTTSFTAALEEIAAAHPQVLFLPGYDEAVRRILKEARAVGIEAIFLGSDGWSPLTATAAADHETYFTQHWMDDPTTEDPRERAFVAAHRKALGYPPFDLPALTYDAFGLLMQAIESSPDLEAESIRDTLANMVEYRGLTGSISFRGRGGDPLKPLLLITMTPSGASLRRSLLWAPADDPLPPRSTTTPRAWDVPLSASTRNFDKSLVTRLVGSFLLVSLLTVGLLGALAFARARQALQDSVRQRLETSANLEEQALNQWVNEEVEVFEILASLPPVDNALGELLRLHAADEDTAAVFAEVAATLTPPVNAKSAWQELLVLSERAEILFSTEPEHRSDYRILDRYFTSGLDRPYVQKVYPSPMTFVPTITLSRPILAPPGSPHSERPIGVLALHLNLERMDEIVLHKRPGSGPEGESYLVDRYNVFISSNRFGTEEFPRGVRSEGIDAALKGHSGFGLYDNYRGTPVIGVYRWIDDLDVALLTEIPQAEAFAPARRLASAIGILGFGLAFLLSLGIFLLARQIARPILEVAATAVKVADGDLGARAPVMTRDEIGLLAQTFNDMTERLSKLYEDLQREIGERRRIEEEREDLISELEGRNAELERFTYTVSHDLKSPLVTIRGFLGLLRKDAERGDKKRMEDDIRRIQNASETMMRLLDELLELSRIGRLVNSPEPVSISALAHEAAELLAGAIGARGVRVEVAEDRATAFGDRFRLLEVLQNLLENAIKFMGDQADPRIEVGTDVVDGMVRCRVQDNGIGINARYHQKIFGLFDRLDVQQEGTGIGLALVRRIIEVHGGQIWVESKGKGHGSTFYFTLPKLAPGDTP